MHAFKWRMSIQNNVQVVPNVTQHTRKGVRVLKTVLFLNKYFFSVRLLSVLRGHSFLFIPATTANDLRLRRIFYPRFYPSSVGSFS